jgi:hypothetical protein
VILSGGGTLQLHRSLEGGTLAPGVRWDTPGGGEPALGDLDGDLRTDVLVPTSRGLFVYRGACQP